MRVLILGGDGYLGWPTAMHLSAHGHAVLLADNYLRRRLCLEQSCEPLFAVPNLPERATLWRTASGREVEIRIGDLADWSFVSSLFADFLPDAIVHYAEQPSAPYSMLSQPAAHLTLSNNLVVTLNLVQAVLQFAPDAHIVKLGTMGEYGTPNIDIEEGWIDIEHKGRRDRFLFPRQASSLYHTTKIMDTDLLWFYVRTNGIRVTDLMQGPVYGLWTDETGDDERLFPFLNYDEIFGTVLNRFLVQAVAGYPLTVYGQGSQTRGYLDIRDTMACIRLSVENPAPRGQLRIFNQFTETFSVNELAARVRDAGRELDLDVEIRPIANPRIEKESHYYNPAHSGLLDLGLEPHYLTAETLVGLLTLIARHKDRIDAGKFVRQVRWTGPAPRAKRGYGAD
jgi:UDP-sulfoquinovose synthase